MPQIHLHAEPGDYAPVVLLPGDPNRATRIAARFDGGVEGSRLVTSHRGLLGYTGTVDGVPVSVQTTMMGAPTTTIVIEELLMLGVTTFIRVGHDRRLRAGSAIGDAVVALAAAACTGVGRVLGGGEPTAPTAELRRRARAARRGACAQGLTTHVGPIVTGDVFYDPSPGGAVRWGRRGYLVGRDGDRGAVPARDARAGKGRPVRAGTILTVSDVISDPAEAGDARGRREAWFRPPEDEVTRRVDLTIGAALAAAAALGRG